MGGVRCGILVGYLSDEWKTAGVYHSFLAVQAPARAPARWGKIVPSKNPKTAARTPIPMISSPPFSIELCATRALPAPSTNRVATVTPTETSSAGLRLRPASVPEPRAPAKNHGVIGTSAPIRKAIAITTPSLMG